MSGPRWSLRALLAGLLTIGLAACGTSPSPPPTMSSAPSGAAPSATTSGSPVSTSPTPSGIAAAVDVCALLPPVLLSGALGGELAFAQDVPSGGWAAGQCAWNGDASSFIVRIGTAASITSFGDPAASDAKALLAAFKKDASAASSATEVPGIGDEAVLGAAGMAARAGDIYIEITRLRLTDDQLVEIMRLAIANI